LQALGSSKMSREFETASQGILNPSAGKYIISRSEFHFPWAVRSQELEKWFQLEFESNGLVIFSEN
jgi:hypothetical protein